MNIYVSNLSFHTSEEDLKIYFQSTAVSLLLKLLWTERPTVPAGLPL
jgi:hypothetical protein